MPVLVVFVRGVDISVEQPIINCPSGILQKILANYAKNYAFFGQIMQKIMHFFSELCKFAFF